MLLHSRLQSLGSQHEFLPPLLEEEQTSVEYLVFLALCLAALLVRADPNRPSGTIGLFIVFLSVQKICQREPPGTIILPIACTVQR